MAEKWRRKICSTELLESVIGGISRDVIQDNRQGLLIGTGSCADLEGK